MKAFVRLCNAISSLGIKVFSSAFFAKEWLNEIRSMEMEHLASKIYLQILWVLDKLELDSGFVARS